MSRARFTVFLLPAALTSVLAANLWFGAGIRELSQRRAAIKRDYSIVNGIKYGLLSVNVWRDNLRRIASDRINDFSLTRPQKKKMEAEISRVLESMVARADSIASSGGPVKRLALRLFVNWNEIRTRVPEFSALVMDELAGSKTKNAVLESSTIN